MIKSIKTILSQDKEKFKVPNKVQDLIPIKCIWPDGIFKIGNKFSKTYKFSDINYLVASREDKESMFLTYSELLNSLDSGATTKITINNHRLNKADFEDSILTVNTVKKSVFRRTMNESESTRKNCADLRRLPPRSRKRQEIPQRKMSRREDLTPVSSVIRQSKLRSVLNTPSNSLPVLQVKRL